MSPPMLHSSSIIMFTKPAHHLLMRCVYRIISARSILISIRYRTFRIMLTLQPSWQITMTTYNLRNNIFYCLKGSAFYNITGVPTQHDYNDIFSLGPIQVENNSAEYTTLGCLCGCHRNKYT
jgi:hypothetical protein